MWPKIVQGNHTKFIYHESGQVEMQTDWAALEKEIQAATTEPVKKFVRKTRRKRSGGQ